MLLHTNDLAKIPVFDSEREEGLFLGYVLQTLVDKDKTKVLGFVVRMRIFRPKRAFPFKALKWVDKEFFLVKMKEVKWLPRHKELYKAYREGKQAKVLKAVEGGTVMGKVTDFIADSSTGEIVKVQIDQGLLSKLVNIPRDEIITLTEDTAVLKEGAVSGIRKPLRKPTKKPTKPLLERLAVGTARGLAIVTHKTKQRAPKLEDVTVAAGKNIGTVIKMVKKSLKK